MALIAVTLPAQSALTVAPGVSEQMGLIVQASLAIGLLGMALTLFMVFKPRLAGKLHGMYKAHQVHRGQGARLLQRLARKFDQTEPALAAELRYLGRN